MKCPLCGTTESPHLCGGSSSVGGSAGTPTKTVQERNIGRLTFIGYRDGDGPVFQIREGSGESTKGLKRVYEMEAEE